MSSRLPIAALASAATFAHPAVALACPTCALDGGPSSRLWVVIGMLAMPFLVALLLAPIIRRALRPDDHEEDSS